MVHDPLSPSEALRTRTGTALVAVSLFVTVYSIVFIGRLWPGVWTAGVLTVGLYLTYRILVVLDSIADAAQRFADVREREVNGSKEADGANEADEAGGDRRFDRSVDSK